MAKKYFFYVITLFFLNNVFHLCAMEANGPRPLDASASPFQHGKGKRPNLRELQLPISATRSSSGQGGSPKVTPRTFEEISQIVKSSPSLRKPLSPKIQRKSTEDASDIIRSAARDLADQIHLDPDVLAEMILKMHGEQDKAPLPQETKAYEDLLNNNKSKYDDLVLELLAMIVAKEKNQAQAPLGKLADTHFGMLRNAVQEQESTIDEHEKTIRQQNSFAFWLKIYSGAITFISAGFGIWASYAQANAATSDSGVNGTAT